MSGKSELSTDIGAGTFEIMDRGTDRWGLGVLGIVEVPTEVLERSFEKDGQSIVAL